MGGVVAVVAVLSVLALLQPAPVPRHVPFAVDQAAESEPAWSPDGKTLAYIREVDGIGQVFTHGTDGGMAVQLTRSDAPCSRPFWSPDGTRVYYQVEFRTWSIGAAGGQAKIELTGGQSAISPDGSTIAHGHGSAGGGIFLHSTATSTETAYPSKLEGQAMNRYIQFSPDGKIIGALWPSQVEHNIYSKFWLLPFPPGGQVRQLELEATGFSWMADNRRIVAAIGLAGSSNHHLQIVDTRNGESIALTSGPGNEEYPAVAPSQDRIAYTSGPHEKDIVEILIDSGDTQPLLATTRAEALPDWSPDGSQMSYVQDTSGEGSEIWLRSVKGDWSRSLVQNRGGAANATYTNPQFSPDGRRLAYESWEAAGHLIWVTALGGGQSIRVAPERNHQHYPAWSPDGAWVAYRTNAGNKRVIEKAPSGGGTPVFLCETNAGHLVWSGKGDLLAFTSEGLYVVSSNGGAPKKISDLRSQSFGFTRDGRGLLVLSQVKSRWGLWFVDVATGSSRLLRELILPASSTIQGFSLHPDGRRIAAGTQTSRTDIWLLENFERPSQWRRLRGFTR
jgi:Tol biopolymer transport system component